VRARNTVGKLSERPDVRVRAAAVNMFFVRESASGGRVAGAFESRLPALTAAPLGVPFLCRQRKGTKKSVFVSGYACGGFEMTVKSELRHSLFAGMTGLWVLDFKTPSERGKERHACRSALFAAPAPLIPLTPNSPCFIVCPSHSAFLSNICLEFRDALYTFRYIRQMLAAGLFRCMHMRTLFRIDSV